jgi:chromate transport protein ChrA
MTNNVFGAIWAFLIFAFPGGIILLVFGLIYGHYLHQDSTLEIPWYLYLPLKGF